MDKLRTLITVKKLKMPYSSDWNRKEWKSLISSNTQETKLIEFAIFIGNECENNWISIHEESQAHLLPSITNELINDMNLLTLPFSESPESYEKNVSLVEAMVDLFSDFIFMQINRSKKLSTPIILLEPSFNNPEVKESVGKIQNKLYLIFLYKFAFDRVFFLGDYCEFSQGLIELKTDMNSLGKEYQIRRKINIERDHQMFFQVYGEINKRGDKLALSNYKIVTGIRYEINKHIFDLAPVAMNLTGSRLAQLRGWIGSEYLFSTLVAKNIVDLAYAWDVLHSLCASVVETSRRTKSIELVVADYSKRDLKELIAACLSCTPQRARKLLEQLTFSNNHNSKDGIWSRPLLNIDRGFLKLVLPAILAVDPIRLLQLLIENQDASSVRGKHFEDRCIEQISAYTNEWEKEKFVVLPSKHPIYDILGKKKRQTDFVILIGENIILCEAKSIGSYANSREFFLATEAINNGIRQLTTRKEKLKNQASVVENTLRIPTDRLKIVNLVISNSIIFDGYDLSDSYVISLRSLIIFISRIAKRVSTLNADELYEQFFLYLKEPDEYHLYNQHTHFVKSIAKTDQIQIDFDVCEIDMDALKRSVPDELKV